MGGKNAPQKDAAQLLGIWGEMGRTSLLQPSTPTDLEAKCGEVKSWPRAMEPNQWPTRSRAQVSYGQFSTLSRIPPSRSSS